MDTDKPSVRVGEPLLHGRDLPQWQFVREERPELLVLAGEAFGAVELPQLSASLARVFGWRPWAGERSTKGDHAGRLP